MADWTRYYAFGLALNSTFKNIAQRYLILLNKVPVF